MEMFCHDYLYLWVLAWADGPGGAWDPHPEPSHVQQQTEELQTGDGEAWERLCKYRSHAIQFVPIMNMNP